MLKLWKRTLEISFKQRGANQHLFMAFLVPSHAKYYVVSQLKTNFWPWVTLGDLPQSLWALVALYESVQVRGSSRDNLQERTSLKWQSYGYYPS